jgi:hypothetical protein
MLGHCVVYSALVPLLSDAELDALVAEAVVGCYDDDEQLSGLFVMIQDNLAVPFATEVLGDPAPDDARWIEAYRRWAGR